MLTMLGHVDCAYKNDLNSKLSVSKMLSSECACYTTTDHKSHILEAHTCIVTSHVL
jgi:hypothetical protein